MDPAADQALVAKAYGLPEDSPPHVVAAEMVRDTICARKAGLLPIEITVDDYRGESVLAAVRARRLMPRCMEAAHVRKSGFTRGGISAEEFLEFTWQAHCRRMQLDPNGPDGQTLRQAMAAGQLPVDELLFTYLFIANEELERKYDVDAFRHDFMAQSGRYPSHDTCRRFIAQEMLAEARAGAQ